MPNKILATPEARAAIARAKAIHGDVMFHVTGGCCDARSPLCLPANELRLGARDILIGTFEGVDFYEMESSQDECCCCSATYLLDVAPGTTVGFSIEAAPGLRFTLTEKTANAVTCCTPVKPQPIGQAPT